MDKEENERLTEVAPAHPERAGAELEPPSLRLIWFLAGFVLSTTICSVAGYTLTSINIFQNFNRFQVFIAPDSNYLPTARQVRALARAVLDPSKTNVVIGGSSVFYGVGQPAGMTMADNLQRELGDQYRVVNLAMRGGDVSGIAEQTSEMMIRDGYKVIYLADIAVAASPQPIGQSPYTYFFWDARARRYLFDWPPRVSAVGEYPLLNNQAIGAALNSILNFNDLWETLAYEHLMTVLSSVHPEQFWHARATLSDPEAEPARERRYPFAEADLRIARAISQPLSEARWVDFRQNFDVAIPPPIRSSMLVAVCENSPFYMMQLTEQERANREVQRRRTIDIIDSLGATAVSICDTLDSDDYIDRVHMSVSGARKVARIIAETVMARPSQ
jgi:hypothetical protein